MTGALVMDNQEQVRFREASGNGTNFIALQAPASVASDKTITLPDVTGTVVTTGDTGSVTSTMILDGTILNADVNASAAIAGTKVSPDFGSQTITTTGVFSHALGAVGTPSITFTGDLNTGIYSPGADQVAISTNGTGRLFVDSSGRVLVGRSTSIPVIRGVSFEPNLQVLASASILQDAGGASLFLGRRLSVGNGAGLATIYFSGSDGTNVIQAALIAAEVDGVPGTDDMPGRLIFSTTADAASSPTERMRLDSSGRLGLGTSVPDGPIHVAASSNGFISHTFTNTSNGASAVNRIQIGNDTSNGAGQIVVYGSQHSTLPNVLDVNNATNAAMRLLTNNTERVRITAGGLVGIGTAVPGFALEVASNVDYQGYFVNNASGTGVVIGGISGAGAITSQSTATPLVFARGGIEAARIDASSRLLVGTSTARSNYFNTSSFNGPLNIEVTSGSSNRVASFVVNSNGAEAPIFVLGKTRSTTVGGNTAVIASDEIGFLSFQAADGSELVEAARIEAVVDGTPGANDMPGRLVFSTTADGASSPTERMRITNLGVPRLFSSDSGLIQAISAGSGTNENIFVGSHSATSTITGTNCILIKANGDIQNTNNSYTGISDIKLKENIVDAGSQWDDLKALRVVKYNLKPETNQETHTQIGLIAQEVELVCPRLVKDNPDRDAEGNDLGTVTKSVNYSVLYMKAVKALQEAMERIETLEAKVTALEAS
jgi:hypothetical protein